MNASWVTHGHWYTWTFTLPKLESSEKIVVFFIFSMLLKLLDAVPWRGALFKNLTLVMQTVLSKSQCLAQEGCLHHFVRASATWAPACTQRCTTPSLIMSLIALAWSWALYSWQLGWAVLLTRSNNDLQSVTAIASETSFKVGAAYVFGSCFKVSLGCFQLMFGFCIHPQNKRYHDSWSKVELSDIVSADSVLTTTFWIFLHPQLIGLTGHWKFFGNICM